MAGRPKNTGGQAEELSPEEIRRIDRCLAGTLCEHRNRALLYMGLGSGMRIDEIVKLKIRDIAPHGKILSRIVLETAGVLKEAISLYQKYGFKEYDTENVSCRCDQSFYLDLSD